MTAASHNPPGSPAGVDATAALVLAGCCAIWGVGIVMAKVANTGISPVLNAGLRSVAAGILVLLWARLRGIELFGHDGTLRAGLLAGIFFAAEFLALYAGLASTPASRATLFLHCAPFVAAYGEHLLVPGHRLTAARLGGLIAAFAGLGVAMGEGVAGVSRETLLGDLLCLAGGVLWGATTVVIRASGLKRATAEKTLLYQLAVSAAVLPPASIAFGEAGITALTPAVAGAFAYTVVAVVFVGYTTWFWLMRRYSAASLHAFTFLTPMFGVIAGRLLLAEPLSPGLLFGLTLVALGIYLVNRPEQS
ncbi:MAG: DMT family transporter [Hyphomicrobiaceae bacterium]